MPYLLVSDFKYGMDRRRERVSGIPGTLWSAKNAVISRGGDIVTAKKFDSVYTLPATSFGLASVRGQIYTFGSADLAASVPIGVRYQRLQSPNSAAMVRVLDAKAFDGKLYVIAEYDDGNIHHFYDGSRVTDWDTIADANADFPGLAAYLAEKLNSSGVVTAEAVGSTIVITADTPGTAFSISKSTVDQGANNDQDITLTTEQANVAEVAEVQATGSVEITGGSSDPGINVIRDITVNGVSLLASPLDFILDNEATATALALQINNRTAIHTYTAAAAGAVVTITAPAGTGATPNGYAVVADIPGTSDVTTTDTNFSGGVAYVAPVAQVVSAALTGTFQSQDEFTITLNSVDYVATGRGAATGTFAYVRKGRVYSTAGSLVRFCQIDDPLDWTTTTTSADAGFINVASDSVGSERLIAMADYNNYTAIFSVQNVFIYALEADADLNEIISVLDNTGTRAAGSVIQYGNRDVFYLDDSGVRSIQARDSSGDARTDDVGTVVDPFVQDWLASAGDALVRTASAAIEARDSIYFLAVGTRVFVFSRYPTSKIAAWCYIDLPSPVQAMTRSRRDLLVRYDDEVHVYGGWTGEVYPDEDELPAVIETPFLTARDDAGIKMLTGFDVSCVNDWKVDVLVDPDDTSKVIDAGKANGPTYHKSHGALPGRTSHVAMKFTCSAGGRGVLSSMALHYTKEEAR